MKNGSVIIIRFTCRSISKIVFGETMRSKPNIADKIPTIKTKIIFSYLVIKWRHLAMNSAKVMEIHY